MSTHVTLTEQERAEVLAFWRDYVLSGGEGPVPSAFQLDALNDETVRDTFLFWHVGGNPFAQPDNAWIDNQMVTDAMEVLGPLPTNYNNVIKAMAKAVQEINASPDLDHVDTATVLVLSNVMMGMLLKRFDEARKLLTNVIDINTRLAERDESHEVIHRGPLEAMGMALAIISATERKGDTATAERMLKDVFAVDRLPELSEIN